MKRVVEAVEVGLKFGARRVGSAGVHHKLGRNAGLFALSLVAVFVGGGLGQCLQVGGIRAHSRSRAVSVPVGREGVVTGLKCGRHFRMLVMMLAVFVMTALMMTVVMGVGVMLSIMLMVMGVLTSAGAFRVCFVGAAAGDGEDAEK